MLVLSRQRDETIMIGDDIEITVVDIRRDKVRLGIKAPSDVPVHRKEVYEAIQRENQAAAEADLEEVAKPARPQEKAAPSQPGKARKPSSGPDGNHPRRG